MSTPKSRTSAAPRPHRRTDSRRDGLRQVRIWIPDLDDATFRTEAHRQSLAVASSRAEQADQAFVNAISDPLPTE